MLGDPRLTQLARLLNRANLTIEQARQAIARDPRALATALLEEAAQNDDVLSADAARGYLDDRLAYFGDLAPPDAAQAIRAEFNERLRAWE